MMSRSEFSKQTKREALHRAHNMCEAEGHFYGWEEGVMCLAPLSYGVEFDHVLACSNGGDNALENCLAVCKKCHRYKTDNFDTPRAAKIKRVGDKHTGITRPKGKIQSRGFRQFKSNTKQLDWGDAK